MIEEETTNEDIILGDVTNNVDVINKRREEARKRMEEEDKKQERIREIKNKKYNGMTMEEKEILLPIMEMEIKVEKKKKENERKMVYEMVENKLRELAMKDKK